MVHKPPWASAPVSNIRFKGVFDYYGLMEMIFAWMQNRGYIIYERVFKHKMGGGGWEYERELEGQRKVTDYIKYVITVGLHVWDAKEVEVVKDGKKIKMVKGRLEVKMSMGIELDYAGRWDSSESMEKIRNFFHNYVIKKDIAFRHLDPLYYSLLSLHTEVKRYLGMEGATSAFDSKNT
jgi:hypothetical protein